jgi:hypothetical protein
VYEIFVIIVNQDLFEEGQDDLVEKLDPVLRKFFGVVVDISQDKVGGPSLGSRNASLCRVEGIK